MNILVTLDSGYIEPLSTMLCSLLKSNRDEHIRLFIAHSSLGEKDFARLDRVIGSSSCEIYSCRLENGLFSDASTQKRITKETYYRLFAPMFLPECVDRILYIDPDTVVINSLKEFYNTDFDGNMIIGAKHFDGIIDLWNRKRLFIKKSPSYINAGVILMNIEEMRKNFSASRVLEITQKSIPKLFLDDQDVLNILYDGKIKIYDENMINLDERAYSRLNRKMSSKRSAQYVKDNTMIIHFDGKHKPWHKDYSGALGDFYYHYNDLMAQHKEVV